MILFFIQVVMFCTAVKGGPLKSWNWQENIPINSINQIDLSSNQSTGLLDKSSTNALDQSTIKHDQFPNMVYQYDNELDQSSKELVQSAMDLNQSNMELDQSNKELDQSSKKLSHSSVELDQSNKELDQSSMELDQSAMKLDQSKMDLNQSSKKLNQSNMELDQSSKELDQLNVWSNEKSGTILWTKNKYRIPLDLRNRDKKFSVTSLKEIINISHLQENRTDYEKPDSSRVKTSRKEYVPLNSMTLQNIAKPQSYSAGLSSSSATTTSWWTKPSRRSPGPTSTPTQGFTQIPQIKTTTKFKFYYPIREDDNQETTSIQADVNSQETSSKPEIEDWNSFRNKD
ncbi:uncharacterized protein LOC111698362 [Eurytemora carolleeae]|uniref:uncharacterized protein LOC111698362 n=1 Tax=Eurytemora carolleeae TaxID=1294199 RepID=UPI000C786C19|nr:uncharacterized protein LOC111698362 [Eurytemora carolleeae]|eukprot:XP_023324444.1 uncharacterized protein LOC111698362 [Eurytemora affinis]